MRMQREQVGGGGMGGRGGVCVFVLASLMTHGPQSEGRRPGGADGAAAQGAEQDHGDVGDTQAGPIVSFHLH